MAENVVAFLLTKLDQLLTTKLDLILSVDVNIRSLRNKLTLLRAFLEDVDARRRDNKRIRVWVEQVRDVAFQAEDAIDRYVYEVQVRRRAGFLGSLKSHASYARRLRIRHQLGTEIEGIRQMLQEISASKSEFGIEFIQSEGEASSSSAILWQRPADKSMPTVEETNVVGFEHYAKTLEEKLLKGDPRRAAVCIVGMGGLGKTTLARKVYSSDDVKKHFDCQAWIYVSQKYNKRELLQMMLESLVNVDRKEINEMYYLEEMKTRLREQLRTRKYLLVIDDIWDRAAWEDIRGALPDENNGSRIMVTTRKKEVAQQVDPQVFIHEPDCLNDGDSWNLFCLKAFGDKAAGYPPELEKIGREMVSKCAGLPLAITVLGGLLSRKPKSDVEWRKVLKRIEYELQQREDNLNVQRILALSYDDLPYYLRSCFLYLGLYPEDSEIDVERLIQLWVAEGFIQARGAQTMEEVAEDYMEELVDRSMVQVVERNHFGGVSKCRIHDLLLDLCISQGTEDKFLGVIASKPSADNAHLAAAPRRVAIHNTGISECLPSHRSSPSLLRSVVCFDPEARASQIRLVINNLKLLRVLDLNGAHIERLPTQIGGLVHLRYLGLERNGIYKLPSSIGKLHNLQTLRLGNGPFLVPDAVWKIESLRHITGDEMVIRWPIIIHCSRKDNLQTLWGINAGSWMGRSLHQFTNLQALRIWGILATHVAMLSRSLGALSRLNRLRLDLACSSTMAKTMLAAIANHPILYELIFTKLSTSELRSPVVDILEDRLDLICKSTVPCLLLPYLGAGSGRKWELPQPRRGSLQFPLSLVHLEVGISSLFTKKEDLASSLENLPNLKFLILYSNAYEGVEIVFSPHGFPKLQELQLRRLEALEQLTIGDGAMPCLQKLTIDMCASLKAMPEWLHHTTMLQQLDISKMPYEFTQKFQKDEGEEWYKVQHIPSVII